MSARMTRHCMGCRAPYGFGVACTRCWARLPRQIRHTITRGTRDQAGVALIHAAHWFAANPARITAESSTP